jgi:deoxyadenosine/deoxycytidine kinase
MINKLIVIRKMKLFSIEGNIGSGKSTFINKLKESLKHVNGIPVVYVPEPVEEWENIQSVDGRNMIELFYADSKQYAFAFQMMAYITRLAYLKREIKKYPDCILISERSLLADYYVFARMLYDSGDISQEQYSIYILWFNEFLEDVVMTGIIYLKTDPEICFERCTTRARKGENTISLDYLTTCSKMHDTWLNNTSITILELTDNSEEEIEEVEMFIFNETYEDEAELENSDLYKMTCMLGLTVLIFSYAFKAIYIIHRVMN